MKARAAVVPILALGAACAMETTERPTERFAVAEAQIEQAEDAGPSQYGQIELSQARHKLEAARAAADDGDTEKALRLVEEAQVEAELASALERAGEAEEAAQEIRDSIAALRRESQG